MRMSDLNVTLIHFYLGGSTPYKTFGQVKVEQLGMGDKVSQYQLKITMLCPWEECYCTYKVFVV